MRTKVSFAALAFMSALALVGPGAASAGAAAGDQATTEFASISTGGVQGNDISGRFAGPAISGNGRVVAFDSIATNLVVGDTNRDDDVFVHDRDAGTTERISVSTAGKQGNDSSGRPSVDGDGNLIAFDSNADNLVKNDTNPQMDVFVRDRAAGTTKLIDVSSDEVQGDGGSNSPSISDDGRYVAFISTSSNLVDGDTNGTNDVFVRDLVAGTTELVSMSSDGVIGNSSSTFVGISGDGRWVAFSSFASNLVDGDTNDAFDTFIHDRVTGSTQLVSQSTGGDLGNAQSTSPTVNGNGRYVVFWSNADNLVANDTNGRSDGFIRDIVAGTTERFSVGDHGQEGDGNTPEPGVRGFTASSPDITPDGRYITFFSSSANLVDGDTNTCPPNFDQFPGKCPDAFVRDRVAGTTVRVNLAPDGTQGNDRTADAVISDDGKVVAFFSAAANLVAGDLNTCPVFQRFPGNCPDIIVHDETGAGAECTLTGTGGDDTLTGTQGADRICGKGGDDTIKGLAGDDELLGGPGADTIIGGPGADMLSGAGGNDVLRSNDGAPGDVVKGGPGRDRCVVDSGDLTKGCEKVVAQKVVRQ
jgi:Tol biopolymer transport system component